MNTKFKSYIDPEGREWCQYLVDWSGPDGAFSFTIYALSMEHAAAAVQDIRETATLHGLLIERIDCGGER